MNIINTYLDSKINDDIISTFTNNHCSSEPDIKLLSKTLYALSKKYIFKSFLVNETLTMPYRHPFEFIHNLTIKTTTGTIYSIKRGEYTFKTKYNEIINHCKFDIT